MVPPLPTALPCPLDNLGAETREGSKKVFGVPMKTPTIGDGWCISDDRLSVLQRKARRAEASDQRPDQRTLTNLVGFQAPALVALAARENLSSLYISGLPPMVPQPCSWGLERFLRPTVLRSRWLFWFRF